MRLVFAGTPDFAAQALSALVAAKHEVPLVLTQPDRPAGRGLRPLPSAVKRVAEQHGLDVFQPESLKDTAALDRVAATRPDVVVVAAYGLILPQRALEIAPRGALNIHASLLPRWRGAAPIQRALLAGDRETGICIMQMDAGLDTGPVLSRHPIAIEADDDTQTLHDKLSALGAHAIVRTLDDVAAGRAQPAPQPAEGVTYARKIAKEEAELDWTRSNAELDRVVRAFRPAPGARTLLNGEALKIWRACPAEGRGAAGTVLRAGPDGLLVACGEGALRATELQRPGGKRVSAAELLRGHPIAPGVKLGASR